MAFDSNNKRIAKNTVFLYTRMVLLMAVNLYISRIVLKELGVEDYGLYSIVGSVVSFLGFINASMTAASQRFLAYSKGFADKSYQQKTFNSVFWAQIIIAAIILLLGETFGIVYISTYLNIEPSKINLAHIVFQFSLFSFIAKTVSVPYTASIIANERMGAFALLSIIEAILQLSVALFLQIIEHDKLLYYSFGMFLSVLLVQVGFSIYSKNKFNECKVTGMRQASQIRDIFTYSGWNLLGSFSCVLIDQGVNMILNSFFGVVVNAARGIAFQVSAAIASLSGNFQQAMNPPIVKSYARHEMAEMHKLIMNGTKFSFYLLLLLSFPIFCNLHNILIIWLDKVPEYTELFCRLAIINSLISSLSGPILTGAMATGKIKKYQIIVATINMLNFPLSFILLKYFSNPYITMYVMISVSLVALAARLILVSKMLDFSKKIFTNIVFKPIFQVLIISIITGIVVMKYMNTSLSLLVLGSNIILCFILIVAIITCAGITNGERAFLWNQIHRILHI